MSEVDGRSRSVAWCHLEADRDVAEQDSGPIEALFRSDCVGTDESWTQE